MEFLLVHLQSFTPKFKILRMNLNKAFIRYEERACKKDMKNYNAVTCKLMFNYKLGPFIAGLSIS